MKLNFNNIYTNWDKIFQNDTIDLKEVDFFDPWSIGITCLKAIEYKDNPDKKLILPKKVDAKRYLKRMHFYEIMREFTYRLSVAELRKISMNERNNPNIQEILHCYYRDQFAARLESGIRRMFRNFGMDKDDEGMATGVVAELGNNVFDHNEGAWPTDVRGAIIVAQNYPKIKQIEVVVADPGVGFFGSLKALDNPPKTDLAAIEMGLIKGISGRIGERRGNGLRIVKDWTIRQLNGTVKIHSGDGLVVIDKNGQKSRSASQILGTLAELVVSYK